MQGSAFKLGVAYIYLQCIILTVQDENGWIF